MRMKRVLETRDIWGGHRDFLVVELTNPSECLMSRSDLEWHLHRHHSMYVGAKEYDDLMSALSVIAERLDRSFDPGGNLPDDCAEWAEDHSKAIELLRETIAAHSFLTETVPS